MKRNLILTLATVLVLSLVLAACGGGGGASGGAGDATRGKTLYEQTIIGPNAAPGCITCHSQEPGTVLVGPSHAGLGTRAGSAVSGQSAEDYLRESIMTPDAHVTEGFQAGVMYQNYAKDLSEQEINDLVAYMLTLK